MYETEANLRTESSDQIPPEVIASFGEMTDRIAARTLLPWGEHCTECAWPSCYATCDLYDPRKDGRCRRFVDGMVRIDCPTAANSYLLKIRFKRWGKLWAPATLRMKSAKQAARIEERDYRIGKTLYRLPGQLHKIVVTKRYSLKKRMATSGNTRSEGESQPTSFLLECYNPGPQTIQLTLTIRSASHSANMPFQGLFTLSPGFNRIRTPLEEIARLVDWNQHCQIELTPNEIENGTTLYFGVMDFVHELDARSPAKKVKCVVWDLDHTLWDGILVEDGSQALVLKCGIAGVLETLDRRGILNSIASKNGHDDAMAVLRRFGIDKYFLAPQISWAPKSDGLRSISRELNIGLDSILFVDDSTFELQQVAAACPEVRTMDARNYRQIPEISECRVPVTEETTRRRELYQVESVRRQEAQAFGEDYLAFLRHCRIRISISPLSDNTLERVHELTQRTNQMNFSGTRYDRETLRAILAQQHLDTYVISCGDRFGSYGVVGFSVVDIREPRMIDLMFSCRVQSKRVEHAFLIFLIRKYVDQTASDFFANYAKTPRNTPSGRVFSDLGMQELSTANGVTTIIFSKEKPIVDDQIIQIETANTLA
jgi:FkbH-like protein